MRETSGRQTPGRAQDPQPCLAHGRPGTAAQIPSYARGFSQILLWFEKQCRQILANTNLICDTEKPKNLLTKQPCPCTARHLASFLHNQLFYCRHRALTRRSCRCNKTHPSFKRFTTVTVSWLKTQAGKLMN